MTKSCKNIENSRNPAENVRKSRKNKGTGRDQAATSPGFEPEDRAYCPARVERVPLPARDSNPGPRSNPRTNTFGEILGESWTNLGSGGVGEVEPESQP